MNVMLCNVMLPINVYFNNRKEKQKSKVYKKRLIRPLLKAQDKLNKLDKPGSTTTTSPSSPERLCQKYDTVSIF